MLRSTVRISAMAGAAAAAHQLWTLARTRNSPQLSTASCEPAEKKNEGTFIGLYLTQASRRRLQQFLDKSFSEGERKFTAPSAVVLHASAPHEAVDAYEPIFGTDGAVRVKGLVITDSSAAAVGSVSTFFGPLDGLHFEVSIPVSGSYSYAAMLPSALAEVGIKANDGGDKSSKASTGVFTRKDGIALKFQGEKYSYIPFPEDIQLRLRGVICSVDRIQDDGSCKCDDLREKLDRHLIAQNVELEAKRKEAEPKKEGAAGEQDEEPKSECPLCVFIKGGPCVEEFKVWDACLKANQKRQAEAETQADGGEGEPEDNSYSDCLEHMKVMMGCMMKHEYYDVFTSRGEDDIDEAEMQEEAQASQSEAQTVESQQASTK